jgi:hypothetical protein
MKKVYRFLHGRPNPLEAWEKEFPDLRGKELIFHSEHEYAVVIDKAIDIDWETKTAYDEKEIATAPLRARVCSEVARLETLVGKKWPTNDRKFAKRMIGECLVQAFRGQDKGATAALDRAEQFVTQKSFEVSRCLILGTSLILFTFLVSVGMLIYVFRDQIGAALGESMVLSLLSACMGGIGTFVAVILRIRKLAIPSTSGGRHHRMEAICMMTTGCVAGFVVMLLVRSGIAFSAYADNAHFPYLVMVLAMSAGMSMRWVRIVMGQFDKADDKTTTNDEKDASPTSLTQGGAGD